MTRVRRSISVARRRNGVGGRSVRRTSVTIIMTDGAETAITMTIETETDVETEAGTDVGKGSDDALHLSRPAWGAAGRRARRRGRAAVCPRPPAGVRARRPSLRHPVRRAGVFRSHLAPALSHRHRRRAALPRHHHAPRQLSRPCRDHYTLKNLLRPGNSEAQNHNTSGPAPLAGTAPSLGILNHTRHPAYI